MTRLPFEPKPAGPEGALIIWGLLRERIGYENRAKASDIALCLALRGIKVDTGNRLIRTAIEWLREEAEMHYPHVKGYQILSDYGGGYWRLAEGEKGQMELARYCAQKKAHSIAQLRSLSIAVRKTMPELLRQMALELEQEETVLCLKQKN